MEVPPSESKWVADRWSQAEWHLPEIQWACMCSCYLQIPPFLRPLRREKPPKDDSHMPFCANISNKSGQIAWTFSAVNTQYAMQKPSCDMTWSQPSKKIISILTRTMSALWLIREWHAEVSATQISTISCPWAPYTASPMSLTVLIVYPFLSRCEDLHRKSVKGFAHLRRVRAASRTKSIHQTAKPSASHALQPFGELESHLMARTQPSSTSSEADR